MGLEIKMTDLFDSKKTICVFAHPDDESMGPGGTLVKLSKNTEIQLICVTDGDSPNTEVKKLAEIRRGELEESCKVLGIKKIYFLNYKDGGICNGNYHEIAGKIQEILEKEKPDTLITFESRGVTGHIDHIAVSMITTFVFEKLAFIKSLYYYCMSDVARALVPSYFVYFPPGHKKTDVDLVVDISETLDTQIEAIKCNTSQARDVKRVVEILGELPKEEYFLASKK